LPGATTRVVRGKILRSLKLPQDDGARESTIYGKDDGRAGIDDLRQG
jgi:hypothetical protein